MASLVSMQWQQTVRTAGDRGRGKRSEGITARAIPLWPLSGSNLGIIAGTLLFVEPVNVMCLPNCSILSANLSRHTSRSPMRFYQLSVVDDLWTTMWERTWIHSVPKSVGSGVDGWGICSPRWKVPVLSLKRKLASRDQTTCLAMLNESTWTSGMDL